MRIPSHLGRLAAILVLTAAVLPAQRGGGGPIKQGKWARSSIPDGWCLYETKHYQIQSQAGKDKAKRLGKHMELMFKLYKKTFPPGKGGFIKKPIKLFKDQEAYLAYGAPPGTGGYYTWGGARELVGYDTGVWQDKKSADEGGPTTGKKPTRKELMEKALKRPTSMDVLGVLSHEGWHQYFHWYVVSSLSLPSWVNEGMGDYFYTAVPPYGAKGKDAKVRLGRLNDTRLPTIRFAVKSGQHVPVKEIIRYEQADYYARPGLCYAEGWALCHFLMQHENKKYRMIIPKFIKYVKDDGNIRNCMDRALKGFDLDELEQEWCEWVLQQKLPSEIEAEKALAELEAMQKEEAEAAAKKALEEAGIDIVPDGEDGDGEDKPAPPAGGGSGDGSSGGGSAV